MKLIELFKTKQLKILPEEKKLNDCDIKKIQKNLPDDIFGNTCSIWRGVICNEHKAEKGQYINFYFNKKKASLHRLLYENFKDSEIIRKTYLYHTCGNKRCCCINHLEIKKDKEIPKKDDIHKISFMITF